MGVLRKIPTEGGRRGLEKEPQESSRQITRMSQIRAPASQYASFLWIPWGSGSATRPSSISKAEDQPFIVLVFGEEVVEGSDALALSCWQVTPQSF